MAPDYESGGREFESLRARHFFNDFVTAPRRRYRDVTGSVTRGIHSLLLSDSLQTIDLPCGIQIRLSEAEGLGAGVVGKSFREPRPGDHRPNVCMVESAVHVVLQLIAEPAPRRRVIGAFLQRDFQRCAARRRSEAGAGTASCGRRRPLPRTACRYPSNLISPPSTSAKRNSCSASATGNRRPPPSAIG